GAHGCVGVMIPSVDKVGRYFPLAAASPLEPGASPLAVAIELDDWFGDVEELLLETLAETPLELEAFDERLAGLGPNAATAAWPGMAVSGAGAGAGAGADADAGFGFGVGFDSGLGLRFGAGGGAWHFGVRRGDLADALGVLGASTLMDVGW